MPAVVVYQDADFRGRSQALGPGGHDMGGLTVGNDAISSLQVPDGWTVTLYEHEHFQGRHRTFTADTAYVGTDFDDIASSVSVTGPAAVVYEGRDFTGRSQTLTPGRYDAQQLTVGTGTISSLQVPAGWTVKLCTEVGFWGRVTSFTADAPYVGADVDDCTSSVVVIDPAVEVVDRQLVLVVAPATGRQGEPVPLAIAVQNPWSTPTSRIPLEAIEVSGVPADFDVVPGTRGAEHAPGHFAWTVEPEDLSGVRLVPHGRPAGRFSLGIVADVDPGVVPTPPALKDPGTTALQFLDVTVVPDVANLRVVLDPLPSTTVIDTAGTDTGYTFFHRPLGPGNAVVFQVSGAVEAHLGFFARDGASDPGYEVVLGAPGSEVSIRSGGEQAVASAADVLDPNSCTGALWAPVDGHLLVPAFPNRVGGGGYGAQLSASATGEVWAVSAPGTDEDRTPSPVLLHRLDGRWRTFRDGGGYAVEGLSRISAGVGSLWGMRDVGGGAVCIAGTATRPVPEVRPVPGRAVQHVCAGVRGQVWGVDLDGRVVVRAGITPEDPAGVQWRDVDPPGAPGGPPTARYWPDGTVNGVVDGDTPTQISCAGPYVWAVGGDGSVWFRDGVTPAHPTGTSWREVPGQRLQQVSVTATGRVWGIGSSYGHEPTWFVRQGVTAADPTGSGWLAADAPPLRQVACTPAGGWAVDADGAVLVRRGAEAPTFWADVAGGLVRVGRGRVVGEDVLGSWQDPHPKAAPYVGVRAPGGTTVHWALTQPGTVALGARVVDQTSDPGTPLQVLATGTAGAPSGLTVDGRPTGPPPGGGHALVVLDRLSLETRTSVAYDTRDHPEERRRLAADLRRLTDDSIVCLHTRGPSGYDPDLADALRWCGANPVVRTLAPGNWSHALVGIPGRGEGSALEDLHAPEEALPAQLDLLTHAGVLERDPGKDWQSSAPPKGTWAASHVLLSGLPAGAVPSAGQKISTAADGTTLWAVPVEDVEGLTLVLPTPTPSAGPAAPTPPLRIGVSLEATAALSLGAADLEGAATAASASGFGYASDGMNVWAGARTSSTVGVRTGVAVNGGPTVTISASAGVTAGTEVAGGLGERTVFPCPVCDGSGQVQGAGPAGASTCPRCAGVGHLVAPGARLHVYAGVLVESHLAVSVDGQVATGVTASGTFDAGTSAGTQVVGDLEVYTGSGRYGGKAGGSTFAGVSAEAGIEGSVGVYGSSVGGSSSVNSPGSVGIGGGGTAVWDDGRLSVGVRGELGVALFGVSLDLDITVDTGPLRSLVTVLWDRYGSQAMATVLAGGADAVAWGEALGTVLGFGLESLGDDITAIFQELGDVFVDDIGGPLAAFGVDTVDILADGLSSVGGVFEDVGHEAEELGSSIWDNTIGRIHVVSPDGMPATPPRRTVLSGSGAGNGQVLGLTVRRQPR